MGEEEHSLVCPICGEVSEQPHQIHYGGVACFSCRAFFRRAHQKTRDPKFVCKKGGNCEVTVKNRRKCQKCRYDLCVNAGMRPEAVLTDDQKKIRFRNMIRKKAARKTDAYVSRETIDDSDDSDDSDPEERRRRLSHSSSHGGDDNRLSISSQGDEGRQRSISVSSSQEESRRSVTISESTISSLKSFSMNHFDENQSPEEVNLPVKVKVEETKDNNHQQMSSLNIEPFSVQFDLSLPMDDDFDDNPPSLGILPVMNRTSHEGFSSSLTTPNMSPTYTSFLNIGSPSPGYTSQSHSPSTNTTRISCSSRSRLSSRSSSSRSSTSVSPYSSPVLSSHRSCISSPRSIASSRCCNSTPGSSHPTGPKISIGGFNKKKMAVSTQRENIFLMPCYNYCPIASASHRAKPKHEGSNGDCECGGGGDSEGCSSGGCGGSSGGCGSGSGGPGKAKAKLLHKEPRAMCPMIGDIENWPPVYDDEDVQIEDLTDQSRTQVYPSSENQGGLEEQSGKSFFGSEDTSYSPSLFDSDSQASGKGFFKNPTKYKNGLSGVGVGKSYFEENATDEGSGHRISIEKSEFAPAPETDAEVEERLRVGEGPYKFDVDSVPPAPSMRGRVEVERLIHAYRIAGSQMEVDPEFVKRLIAFHRGYMVMPRSLLKNYIVLLAQKFRHFAIQHQKFITLSKNDQRKLLGRNSSLYIQYLLGKYFSAPTGEEQIRWLLGSKTPDSSELSEVQKIGIHDFNASVKLFRKGTYLDMYEEFANRLSQTNTEPKFNPVMAHFFLFSFDSSDRFVDPDSVAELHADSFKMCPHSRHYLFCSSQPNISGVLETCEAMASFFATNTLWSDVSLDNDDLGSSSSDSSSNETSLRHQLAIPYTQEEENWLCQQMNMFNEAYAAVPLGEDIIKEYVMYTYDVPVSKHFMPVTLSVVNERFRRIMMMHPEVEALTASDQAKLCRSNTMSAVALYIAKMESCKSASQQFQFAFGALDDSIFERDYSHVIKVSRMRKLSLFETNKSTNLLTERMMSDVQRLINNISPLITDFDTFKLLSLITLFTGVGDTMPAIAKLRNRYLTVLRRRPFRVNKKMKLEVGTEYNKAVYKQFTSCLCDIQELASLMQKLRSSLPDSFGNSPPE